MIKVENLHKWYGSKHAVENVSFSLNKGEILGFIGPNGAGKSTTMRMITGFIPISEGRVFIGNHNIEENPIKAKALLGYLPENAPLYANMTVNEFLFFCASLRGYSRSEASEKVDNAVKMCFLEGVRHQNIDTLSKGYKHRTCFAQSIIHDPEVLILDEPTDGLDPNQKREIRSLIKNMGQSKAIILSTHILEEVEAVCTRVLLIDKGRKVFDGTPEELRAQSDTAGSIVLTVSAKKFEDAKPLLEKLPGFISVELLSEYDAGFAARLSPDKNIPRQELCRSVFEFCRKEDWELHELKTEEGRLDDVFHKITANDNNI